MPSAISDAHVRELICRQLVGPDIIKLYLELTSDNFSEFQTRTVRNGLSYEQEPERAVQVLGREDRQSMRISFLIAEKLWSMSDPSTAVSGEQDRISGQNELKVYLAK